METIIIKRLEKKPAGNKSMLILDINGNRKVSVAPWLEQEINFIENDVGVGGNFMGTIEFDKSGKYMNITSVDFNSAKKASQEAQEPLRESSRISEVITKTEAGMLLSSKDKQIIAQSVTKMAVEVIKGENFGSQDDFEMRLYEVSMSIKKNIEIIYLELK